MLNRIGQGHRSERGEIREHLLVALASVLLCAGGVYYWSHHRLERSGEWTPQDTLALKKCVARHLLDPKHYYAGELALVGQLIDVCRGEECRAELGLPPLDESKLKQILHEPLTPRDWKQIQEGLIRANLPVPPPDSESVERPHAFLSSPTPSPADLEDWLKRIKVSHSTFAAVPPIGNSAAEGTVGTKGAYNAMGGEESAKTSAPREIPNSQIQTAAKVSSGSQRVEPAQGLWAQAVARHQEGDEPGALRLTRAAAQAGNSVALYQLGYLYKHGEGGLPRDLREAASWYTKSASLGNPEAEATLGLLYEEGDAVPEDWVKAAQLYQQSAEQNNAIGQSQLARAYEFGIGVHQSRQMAIQWDQRAAALGNAQSAYFARWLKTPSNSVGFRNQEERSLFPGMPDQLIHEPVGVLFHNSAERIAFLRVSAVSMTGKSK